MANRQIYDTVFRDYFNYPPRLLSLCNAVLRTSYDDPGDVRINTLEGAFFSNIKNDLSCLLHGQYIVMLGHQHTSCENLPLRFLMYVAELLNRHVAPVRKRLYQPKLLHIPAPAFFVFYDGNAPEEEQRTLRLSDAFGGESSLELCVRLYNISGGMNLELKERCPFLGDYSRFSDRLKENRRSGMEPDAAIRETLEYCRRNGIMDDYLPYKTKEVFRMLNYAWNEDEAREALTEYGIEQGIAKMGKLAQCLVADGKASEIPVIMANERLCNEMFLKYGIV